MTDRGPAAGFDGAQIGDVQAGDIVGGNIYHGLDAAHLATLVERMLDSQQRIELRMQTMETTYHDNRMADAIDREERRRETDDEQRVLASGINGMRALIGEALTVSRGNRWWLIGLTVALLVLAAVLAAVVIDRAMAGAALTLAGGALAYYLRTR